MLVGKYVFISTGDYYKYGKIIECVDKDEDFYLIQIISRDTENNCASLYNINQMLQVDDEPDDDGVIWMFFNNKKELDKYVKSVEKPKPSGKILSLVRPIQKKTENN